MKSIFTLAGISAITLLTAIEQSSAQSTLAQWNFNSNPADSNTGTGTTTPSIGTGSVSLIGGVSSTFSAGSPGDPAPTADNSGLNLTGWAAQGTGSGTAGLQVATSTVGFNNITIGLDFRQSGTVSRDFQLQVSSDGVNFANVSGGTTSLGALNGNTGTSFSTSGFYVNNPGGGSQNFVQSITYNLALGGAYENDANFAFRWVAAFDPGTGGGNNYISANAGTTGKYDPTGTGRFDMVTVTSDALVVPEPGTLALGSIGLATLAGLCRRKK